MYRETSAEAHRANPERKLSNKELVWNYIDREGWFGATLDECESYLRMEHKCVSPRLNDLIYEGAVIDSGRKRKTAVAGLNATVWVAVPEAERIPLPRISKATLETFVRKVARSYDESDSAENVLACLVVEAEAILLGGGATWKTE